MSSSHTFVAATLAASLLSAGCNDPRKAFARELGAENVASAAEPPAVPSAAPPLSSAQDVRPRAGAREEQIAQMRREDAEEERVTEAQRPEVQLCRRALKRFRSVRDDDRTATELDSVAADVQHVCALTVRDEKCRRALTGGYPTFAQAMEHAAVDCREAYCPTTSDHPPALCFRRKDGPKATPYEVLELLESVRNQENALKRYDYRDVPPLAPKRQPLARAALNPGTLDKPYLARMACTPTAGCNVTFHSPTCAKLGSMPLEAEALPESVRKHGMSYIRVDSPGNPFNPGQRLSALCHSAGAFHLNDVRPREVPCAE